MIGHKNRLVLLCVLLQWIIQVVQGQPSEWHENIESGNRQFSAYLARNTMFQPSVGNGYIASVVGSESIYVGGLFNGKNINGLEETLPSHRAVVPSFINMKFPLGKARVGNFTGGYAIDFEQATFYSRLFFVNETQVVQMDQKIYCHQVYSSVMVQELEFDNTCESCEDATIFIATRFANSTDINFERLEKNDDYAVWGGEITQPETDQSQRVKVGVVASVVPGKLVVPAKKKLSLKFYLVVRTDIAGDKVLPGELPWDAALREYKFLEEKYDDKVSNQLLFDEHVAGWRKIWDQGGIEIEGNMKLARIVNSSIYWILMSVREDWPWGLSPGSLASNAYNGHSFWDCETWMYPPILLLHHPIARSLLDYRFEHLSAAIAKAKSYNHCQYTAKDLNFGCFISPPDKALLQSLSGQQRKHLAYLIENVKHKFSNRTDILDIPFNNKCIPEKQDETSESGNCGYKGALFAWESGFTGSEVCPCMIGGTCLHEHHVSGDIAFAVRQYWYTTRDVEWLISEGFPLVYNIALFWESRVVKVKGMYEIHNVIPPDEAAGGVNNSVFTNIIAKLSFDIAKELAVYANKQVPQTWADISGNIMIPMLNGPNPLHLEHDNYTLGTFIKQADVVLLGYPLMYPMNITTRVNDLEYYSKVTSKYGPAMTWSVTAIGYLETAARYLSNELVTSPSSSVQDVQQDTVYKALMERAHLYFFQSYQNAQQPFSVWTETPTEGAINFITGAGGFLQGLMFGFGGLRIHQDSLHIFHPTLPTNTTGFTLRKIDFLSHQLDIKVNNETVQIEFFEGEDSLTQTSVKSNICWEKIFNYTTVENSGEIHIGDKLRFSVFSHIRLFPCGLPNTNGGLFGNDPSSLLDGDSNGINLVFSGVVVLVVVFCLFSLWFVMRSGRINTPKVSRKETEDSQNKVQTTDGEKTDTPKKKTDQKDKKSAKEKKQE